MHASVASAACAGFQYVDAARTCSWYEHHHLGGCQRPQQHAACTARDETAQSGHKARLGIIIPFRGEVRPGSFGPLCAHLPTHLQQQDADVHIIAVNQVDHHPFNRAALANAAFQVLTMGGQRAGLDVGDKRPFTCVAVHDVDRFPNLANRSCAHYTRSYYKCRSPSPAVLHPESYTGGVLVLRPALFQAVNGFSNEFWGWGHEDNELYLRLRACGRPPKHAQQLDWCMVHRDCDRCKRAKPTAGALQAMRAETKSIALVQSRIMDPLSHAARDGLSNAKFTTAPSPIHLPCGQLTLHVLDVRLHRGASRDAADTSTSSLSDRADGRNEAACTADGGATDDGCVAALAPGALSPRLLARARRGLPSNARVRRVVGATRERAMYNFHYEIDIEVDLRDTAKPPIVIRVAVCAQEWQDRPTPDAVRYQLLWRAVSTDHHRRRAAAKLAQAPALRFRLLKNFSYRGHFPCELRPPPWARAEP